MKCESNAPSEQESRQMDQDSKIFNDANHPKNIEITKIVVIASSTSQLTELSRSLAQPQYVYKTGN